MDELRWILLIVGILVIAGVYGYNRWQDNRRSGGARRRPGTRPRREHYGDDADIDAALSELDTVIPDPDELAGRSDAAGPQQPHDDWEITPVRREPAQSAKAPPVEELPEIVIEDDEPPAGEEKVIVLNVAATDGRLFDGVEIVEALEAVGMRLGEHDIYHRMLETRNGTVSMFSAANILKPGTLRPEELDELRTPGVAMFLQLPGPADGLAAFEQMLDACRRIADQLGVQVLDARRCTLTRQAIEHLREELREYRRRAHLAAKKSI